MRKETTIPRSVIKNYLEAKERSRVNILSYEKLGSGWHGTGYKIRYKVQGTRDKGKTKEVVIRTLMPEGFSHDYLSDRAKVFILQHEMSKSIPGHVKSLDVSGYSKSNELISLGDIKEYFQVVEVAGGRSYSEDFSRIKKTGVLNDEDRKKALLISDYLVQLHGKKYKGTADEERSIRRRHTRDAIGHGEMMMGVIDTYPDDFQFITKDGLSELICKTVKFREKIKDVPFVPRRIHGDFHPGNILFDKKKIIVLDASRELYGDAGDDVCAMAINYIWFAVMQSGEFGGSFSELFRLFWDNYMKKTNDELIQKTAGVHFAFRGVVVAHPVFYSDQSDDTRKKMIKFVNNVLDSEMFDASRINDYLG